MERAGADPGERRQRSVQGEWGHSCGRSSRERESPEAGTASHFDRKMPESGDERTIRTNESQGEAAKTDLGRARRAVQEKQPEMSRAALKTKLRGFRPCCVIPLQWNLFNLQWKMLTAVYLRGMEYTSGFEVEPMDTWITNNGYPITDFLFLYRSLFVIWRATWDTRMVLVWHKIHLSSFAFV